MHLFVSFIYHGFFKWSYCVLIYAIHQQYTVELFQQVTLCNLFSAFSNMVLRFIHIDMHNSSSFIFTLLSCIPL